MSTKVEITTEQGTTLSLSFDEVIEGYNIKEIDGLDPVKATIVSSSLATVDGEQYQSSRREGRNIVFTIGLELGYGVFSARHLRTNLHNYLMPKTRVHMRFFVEGEPTVDIYGRIESFEGSRFTKEPEVVISVLCQQPDFYVPTPVVVNGSTVVAMQWNPIEYAGTVETGILFKMNVNRTLNRFTIFHRPEDNLIRALNFEGPLSAGDVLEISTVPGAKGISLIRDGVRTSRLYGFMPSSAWITLLPGLNDIRVYTEGANIPYTIEYIRKFGGI
jgi:hypothetical protein